MKPNIPLPTEEQEQADLFEWAALQLGRYPELSLLYHIPNGGKRFIGQAVKFKAQGVKPGVPDLCLPVAKNGFHGLYIELKRQKGGRVSEQQTQWLQALEAQGYKALVCNGWEEAANTLKAYLKGGTA